ncbi:MAG: hypothetical protein K0Q87_4291 [Neobacillus sp.]|jgi:hypothetical protein|nr:hypothetical protein [Neobacillus sp.]
MDKKYNTGDDANVEMKKALANSKPKQTNMSEAEMRLKYNGKKS